MNTSLVLTLLLGACGPSVDVPEPVAVQAPDDSGVFVEIGDPAALADVVATLGTPANLQWRPAGGAWSTAVGPVGEGLSAGQRYWLPADSFGGADLSTLELRVAVGDSGSAVTDTRRAGLSIDFVTADPPLLSSDLGKLHLSQSLDPVVGASGALELAVDLTEAGGDRRLWMTTGCTDGGSIAECLVDEPAVWVLDDLDADLEVPSIRLVHDVPALVGFEASIWLDAVDVDGAPVRGLLATAQLADPVASMGRDISWGDLHAHSNLSYDGCELPDDSCDHRGDYAGEDFFDNARAEGLDFAAITDHAEWERYYPEGLDGPWVDIWSEEQRLVQDADYAGLVPLVGYEWTNKRDKPSSSEADAYYAGDYEGGHKTVIFEEIDVPVDFRIGATEDVDTTTKSGLSAYTVGDNPQTDNPSTFFDDLDAAAAKNGSYRVLSFYHHPALEKPQSVDFNYEVNAPDSRYERLVEVYSEHGTSECIDPTADDCDWMVNNDNFRYLERGSVQYALSLGMRLGFTSGTDCHDSKPGSIDDGPSTPGNPGASPDAPLNTQFGPGGLTGVWTAGELDRSTLFDALYERTTLATSGPRPDARVLGIDAQGRPWLPGQVLPADVGPLRIIARLRDTGYTTQRISVVSAGGDVVTTGYGDSLDATIDLEPGGAWYLRVVFTDDSGGDMPEHRVWVSPFFTEIDE